jgi:biopolymer transport protein ExbD
VPLINVVFLLLMFFLVAGTLAPPLDADLRLVRASGLDASPPPDALVLRADGGLSFRGAPSDPGRYWAAMREEGDASAARIVPDRDAPAARLLDVALALREAGASRVVVVAERGLR